MQNSSQGGSARLTIFILGALSTISPLSIDMYLAAFPQVAADLHTSEARVSLSISSYFVGLALGQVFYGPLLDRFGRKPPLYWGLLVYLCASIGCMAAPSVEWLIGLRFVQALGGCGAQVAATAMVRDLFPQEQSAKIFSLLILILGVSPLLAPTAGSFISELFGWQWIFAALTLIAVLVWLLTHFYLPDGAAPDARVSLRVRPIGRRYRDVLSIDEFRTYALAGSFTLAGLFAYVAGSPIIFLKHFKVTPHTYGLIFAILTGGFILSSQCNIYLHRRYRSQEILRIGTYCAFIFSLLLVASAVWQENNFQLTVGLLLVFLFQVGLVAPNSTALSLAPFSENAGTAAAMLGILQMGIGAIVSSAVGLSNAEGALPVFCVFACTIALAIWILGRGNIGRKEHTP